MNTKSVLLNYATLAIAILFLTAQPLSAIRQDFDFEGGNPLAGWTVDGWGVRDVSACQYGPQTAPSGVQVVGVPEVCQQYYPNGNPSQYWDAGLTTPSLVLTGIWPSLYIGFDHWGDFEGLTDEFDGVILQLVNLTQNTTVQIDSAHINHLNPSYDAIIGTTNPPLQGLWAYCWDTVAPAFNSLGYPFLVLQRIQPGQEIPLRGDKYPNLPTDLEWRGVVSVDLIANGYAAPGDTIQIKWYFVSDQLAGGAGYFFDNLFISSEAPEDLQPPVIDVLSPEEWADIPDSNQLLAVTADITDGVGGSGVDPATVFLVWELEGVPQTDISMSNTGGDTYAGELPGQPYDTDIRYRVRAADNLNNTSSSPWRHLEVTDAITLSWDDGMPASVYQGLEAEDGFSVRYRAPADDRYRLHKIMYYFGRPDGQFHVVVNNDAGGPPSLELYRDSNITNGEVANTFFQYEFAQGDSIVFNPDQYFHVGMRLASSDTTLDPQQLTDGTNEITLESWVIQGGAATEVVGETMIRCKVKRQGVTGIGDNGSGGSALPRAYALGQNFPNPFNPSTTIRYAIPALQGGESAVKTRLMVFNMRGQMVKTLVDEEKRPGDYAVQWDGTNVKGEPIGSGIYLYRLEAGDYTSIKKMVVLK